MDYRTIQNAMIKRAEEHTVAKGQTLSGIGKQYGIPWKQIAADNNISNPNNIRVGQKLRINQPVQQPQTQATHSSVLQKNDPIMFDGKPVKIYDKVPFTRRDAFTYTVQKGDRGERIRQANNVSEERFQKANPGVDLNKLRIGQTLNVPVTNRQWIMESAGYDPETPLDDAKVHEAARRIAAVESTNGTDLYNAKSSASGWHQILDSTFNRQLKEHADMYPGWTKESLNDKDNSYKMTEQAIRDFIHRYQYEGNGLIPDDMRPVYDMWRVGEEGRKNANNKDTMDEYYKRIQDVKLY